MDTIPPIYNTAVAVNSESIQVLIRKMAMVIMNWAGRSEKEADHLDHVDVMLLINQCLDNWMTHHLNHPITGPFDFDQRFGVVDFGDYFACMFPTAAKQYAQDAKDDRNNQSDYQTMLTLSEWFTQCLKFYALQLRSAFIDLQNKGLPVTSIRGHDMVPTRSQLFIITSDSCVAMEEQRDLESDDYVVDEEDPNHVTTSSYL